MGKKKSEPAPVQQVRIPSPEETAQAQLSAARGILDLQIEKQPEVTQSEIARLRAIAPEAANSVIDAQNIVLENVRSQFPQFFDVLQGLGDESLSRLGQIGNIPQDVANQVIELSRADQAERGIVDSPLARVGTAGQLAALGQNQRAQDIGLAQGFLNLPFAPNLPLTGVPAAGVPGSSSIINQIQSPSFGELNSAAMLQVQGGFSNAALQRSNALLGGQGGGFSAGGAAGGALGGAYVGAKIGSIVPGLGTGVGAIGGGILGGISGGF